MTGISEILVLIFLILAVLILPRLFKPAPKPKPAASPKQLKGFNAKMRAGIVVSFLLPIVCAMIMKPWEGDLLLFFSVGILPVALAWGLFWIFSARKN